MLAAVGVVPVDSPEPLWELDVGKLGGHLRVQQVAESPLRGLGIVRVHVAVQSQNHRPVRHDARHTYLQARYLTVSSANPERFIRQNLGEKLNHEAPT